jgi:hypothetical protein
MRKTIVMLMGLCLGASMLLTCKGAKDDDDGFVPGGGSSSGSSGTGQGTGDGSGTGDGGTGGGTGDGGSDGGTGGGSSGGDTGDGGSDAGDGGAFIAEEDQGGGGGGGAYEPCPDGNCTTGTCLNGDPPNDNKSFCAPNCSPAGDPSGCPPPPSGDAPPMCIDVGDEQGGNVQSFCALDCSGGQTCPTGMTCVQDSDQNGPITICL